MPPCLSGGKHKIQIGSNLICWHAKTSADLLHKSYTWAACHYGTIMQTFSVSAVMEQPSGIDAIHMPHERMGTSLGTFVYLNLRRKSTQGSGYREHASE